MPNVHNFRMVIKVPAGSKFAHSIKYSLFNYFQNLSIPAYHLPFIVIEFLVKLLLRQRIYWFQGSACRKIFLRSLGIPLPPATKVSKMIGRGYAPPASPHSFVNLGPRLKWNTGVNQRFSLSLPRGFAEKEPSEDLLGRLILACVAGVWKGLSFPFERLPRRLG